VDDAAPEATLGVAELAAGRCRFAGDDALEPAIFDVPFDEKGLGVLP
jgi:hypothetical protein